MIAPVVPPVLSTQQTRALRAKAHGLEPIVQVGHGGISESVVRAVNGALHTHELIKVRLHEPEDKHAMAAQLAQLSRSALCGLVGHTLILYRPRPKTRTISGVAKSSIRRNQTKQPRGRARA
jgi:RNA-binding protein